jgi:hypothetical protein
MSVPQRALVERGAMLQLWVAALDKWIVGGSFAADDAKMCLAFSNSLARTRSVPSRSMVLRRATRQRRSYRHIAAPSW